MKLLKPHNEDGKGAELFQGGPKYSNEQAERADKRNGYYVELSVDDMEAIQRDGGRIWVAWGHCGIGAPIVHTGGRVGDSVLISVREAEPWQMASLAKQCKINGVALDQTRAVVLIKVWERVETVFFMYKDEAPAITEGEFLNIRDVREMERKRI